MFGRPTVSRVFAILLLIALIGMAALAVHAVLQAYRANEQEIAQQKLIIGKLKYVIARAQTAEQSAIPADEDLSSLGFFSGSSDAIVARSCNRK